VTLETPEEFGQWLEVGEKLDAERQVKKDAIELARNIRLKKVPRPPKPGSRGAPVAEDDDEPSD
jgi:ribosome biogenesis GTPase A